ncbi:MAG: hypothetical protein KAR54_02635 [Candidatus Pacebacteria bacterium]|nr:hypothetical protein [Candidatus Paceibacterota bacterium]
MPIIINSGIIIFSSIIIYFAGKKFANISSKIGDYFDLPRDIKGATLDAVSSSLPELLVALYSVIFFQKFEVGIGTIAGSALFNLLIIIGVCVFVAPVTFKVSRKVISRDALFYMIAVFSLVILLIYFKVWGLSIALLLLFIYLFYLRDMIGHTRAYREEAEQKIIKKIKIKKEVSFFFLFMLIIGVATFFLTNSAMELSYVLNISPIIIAFTIIALATSFPDMVISVTNAKKGDIDDAVSNVLGSNTFNILVGLGLPLLIYVLYNGALVIEFANLEIIFGLLGSTILLLYFLADDQILSKRQAGILLFMYLVFVTYIVSLAI